MLFKMFSIQKHQLWNKFDPVIKMVMVNPGSSFKIIGDSQVPDAVYKFQGQWAEVWKY